MKSGVKGIAAVIELSQGKPCVVWLSISLLNLQNGVESFTANQRQMPTPTRPMKRANGMTNSGRPDQSKLGKVPSNSRRETANPKMMEAAKTVIAAAQVHARGKGTLFDSGWSITAECNTAVANAKSSLICLYFDPASGLMLNSVENRQRAGISAP